MSIYLALLLSGFAGLVYQVIWVRVFGQIFGTTVYSASLVTSVFMLGLGAGAYYGGKFADKMNLNKQGSSLLAYCRVEFAIAIYSLILSLLFPHLEALSSATSSYSAGEHGWYSLTIASYFFRYLCSFVLLFPPAILMGSTLTLIIRYGLSSGLKDQTFKIGMIYGINTFGAALGCLFADLLLIPKLGLTSTQYVAVSFNLLAGLLAMRLSKIPVTEKKIENEENVSTHTRTVIHWAIFLSGAAAMGTEIFWFRLLNSVLGNFRSVFSLLLGVILTAMFAGSWAAGKYLRKGNSAGKALTCALILLSLTTFISVFVFSSGENASSAFLQIFFPILILTALPAFFMGTIYPLANGLIQKEFSSVGTEAGMLYLYNTVGAIVGSLLTGFLLLPQLKMSGTFIVLLLALNISVFLSWTLPRRRIIVAISVLTLVQIGIWATLPSNYFLLKSFSDQKWAEENLKKPILITQSEGINELLVILEQPGLNDHARVLYTNGHAMSATAEGAERYMRAFAHIPLLYTPAPESALVICFGVGNTLEATTLHPSVKNIEIADLSKNVLSHSNYFHPGLLDKKNIKVFINDGRQHLRMNRNIDYDLVTLEPPPLGHAGVESLFTKEFYELVQHRLKSGGFITQWLPIHQLKAEVNLAVIKAFIEVFPEAVLLAGEYDDLILMGRKDSSVELDPETFLKHLQERPEVEKDMKHSRMSQLKEIAGMFIADKATLKEQTKDVFGVSDNDPQMEYSTMFGLESVVPMNVFDEDNYLRWCPKCHDLPGLKEYITILKYSRRHESFYKITKNPAKGIPVISFPMKQSEYEATVRGSEYLKRLSTRWMPNVSSFQ